MARFFSLLLAVLLGLPASAGDAGQQAHQAGLVAYARGDLEGALAHFRAARDADPQLVPAHYYEGLTLVELGRPAEAAQAFRRVLELQPAHAEARVDLARLEAAGEAPPGDEAGSAPAADDGLRWWAMRFAVAAGYDSRVLLAPADAFIPLAASGGLLDLLGELQLRPLWNPRHRLEGRVALRRRQRLGRVTDDLSSLELLTGGRYGFRFAAGEDEVELALRYDIGLGWADGGAALEPLDGEAGFHLQAERHAWTASVALLRGERAMTRADFTFLIHHFAGRLSRFNHRGLRHCLQQRFELAADRLDLEFGACLRWADARSDEYDRITPLGRLGLELRVGPLTAVAAAAYEHARYHRSHADRTDHRLRAGLDLGLPFLEVWRLGLGWQHTESFSSESALDYGRDRAVLQLELRL